MDAATTTAPRALLLMGQAGPRQFHNQPEHWSWLAGILRAADLSARVITDDLRCLRPDELAGYDVLLNFSTDLEASEAQIDALTTAVRGGVGYVGLHAATATFRDSAAYHALIGSWFDRHPPIRPFTVEITAPDHPVTAGVPAFEVEDERYELKDMLDDVTVLAHAEGFPMVYVRHYGAGRVCYIAPGHDARTLSRPAYALLVRQAIAWAARRPTVP
jgi:type 1 glutamine amidotransferase